LSDVSLGHSRRLTQSVGSIDVGFKAKGSHDMDPVLCSLTVDVMVTGLIRESVSHDNVLTALHRSHEVLNITSFDVFHKLDSPSQIELLTSRADPRTSREVVNEVSILDFFGHSDREVAVDAISVDALFFGHLYHPARTTADIKPRLDAEVLDKIVESALVGMDEVF
jgi:hypothetical protein